MKSPLVLLASAVACEVLWAVLLKVARGWATPWATGLMGVAYVLSLLCLQAACKRLDVSLAYVVWTGTGATVVALIGVLAFGEPLGLPRAIGFVLVITGVVVLLGFEPVLRPG
jgi:multidrug transporter EmrE-like cation transporter